MAKLSRRALFQWLARALALTAAGVLSGAFYITRLEPRWVHITRLTLAIPRLPEDFEGFRLVQLSDLHCDPVPLADLQAALTLAQNLRPDLFVLTGDYVLRSAASIFDLAPALAGLQAPHGVMAVLGNHDYWTNARTVHRGLTSAGITTLVNQGVMLRRGAGQLYIAGVDDGWSGAPDLASALADCPAETPAIVLWHEPDFADETAREARVVLQLSGHSHGGQVRLPGLGALVLPQFGRKYDMGLYQVGGLWHYTNRGLGYIWPPVRFNCPPEITAVTLTRAG